jgi:hypothetical protein
MSNPRRKISYVNIREGGALRGEMDDVRQLTAVSCAPNKNGNAAKNFSAYLIFF